MNILKGENGSVGRHRTRHIQVDFNETAKNAFEKLHNILASENFMLRNPDYKKPFHLTTDALTNGIAAVHSQEGNELRRKRRELLAIVWP